MGVTGKLMNLGQKPEGFIGWIAGFLMNRNHRRIYQWGLDFISVIPDSVVLDIGCGGGEAIQQLTLRATNGKIYGIDHSDSMVNLAKKTNRAEIAKNRIKIKQASVSRLPFSSGTFDFVTALETIQFWPNLAADLQEVSRVLKPGGEFLIVNRYPPENSRYVEFLQIKSSRAYQEWLTAAEFTDISVDAISRPGWIVVCAKKQHENFT